MTGSVAASVYGEPRLAADIDIVPRKLQFLRDGGSDKHVRDIRLILAATADDRAFIASEVARLELGAQWARCA